METTFTKWYGVKEGSTAKDFAALHKAASDTFTFGDPGFPASVVVKYDEHLKEPSKWRLGVTYENRHAEYAHFACKAFEAGLSENEDTARTWTSFPCTKQREDAETGMSLDNGDGGPAPLSR